MGHSLKWTTRSGRRFTVLSRALAAWVACAAGLPAQDAASRGLLDVAWRLERSGQVADSARRVRDAAAAAPNDPAVIRALVEYLEQHGSPEARSAYARLAALLDRMNAPAAERAAVAHRMAVLDLLAGDRNAAQRDLAAYTAAGGTGLSLGAAASAPSVEYIEIPGPLRGFARMAALAPDMNPADVLPALARNVVINGYRAYGTNQALEQTEYLSLLLRYLSQARELERLAGPEKIIRIRQCESTETGVLLRVIGYRMRGGCGAEVVLETINASRAFLTADSGFPLAQLELALRTNQPFEMDYHPSRVPILYGRDYWQPAKDQMERPFIDYFVSDPSLARLYAGISKVDPATAELMRRDLPAQRFKLFAHVLDFYGAMFRVRDGRALVPGGARAERVWAELTGVGPDKGAQFFERMLMTDDGWLASYFDALARIDGPVQDYLTEPRRLKRFYEAIRGKVTSPGPARPVFRANTDMLLLTARLRLDPDGTPHLPGGLETWKRMFSNPPEGTKYDSKIKKDAQGWKEPDDVLEALFGLTRKQTDNEALKMFMALSDLDRGRAQPLEPAVVERLAREYRELHAQYSLLAETPTLNGSTIIAFLDTANRISDIGNQERRANAAGILQGLAGLWQIFVRQNTLPAERADAALAAILTPFQKIENDRDLFDAGRAGVLALLEATNSPAGATLQERMIDLLAGTAAPAGSEAYQRLAQELIRIFEAQRLVELDTLFNLADNLESVSRGQKLDAALAGRLASRVSEIQLPQADLTRPEKNAGAFGYWSERHIDAQRKINLRREIERAGNDPKKLADLRGELAPFLRDTLVGFNYMHYAPPGAQILLTNPLFVRSHDFVGLSGSEQTWKATTIYGTGWPRNAGGRLVGSLASLPYTLAQAEQNFLIPNEEGSLIWGDLAPQMMLTAVIPRWWNVSAVQTHWVGVHMAYGEQLLAEAALNAPRRETVLASLDQYLSPYRLKVLEDALRAGDVAAARANVMPSELYLLARKLSPDDPAHPLAAEIRRVAAENPQAVSEEAISRAFGTPKPTLANSYRPALLNLRTFPTLMGYSSRILAESWESNLLYFGALADQIHAAPEDLNVLVPEWTQRTTENIFATHLEDWPALLRSLRSVGERVLQEASRELQAAIPAAGEAQ